MKTWKKIVTLGMAVTGLTSTSMVLANVSYENSEGQSAQLTHTMQDQGNQGSSQDGKKVDGSLRAAAEAELVRKLGQNNTLGQSEAMSKTKPYISLIKRHQNDDSTSQQ